MKTTETLNPKLVEEVTAMAQKARAAALQLATLSTEKKNKALRRMAELISKSSAQIIAENKKDVDAAIQAGRSKAILDRLTLDESRVQGITTGLKQIADLPDPIGETVREWTTAQKFRIKQVTVPLGVIGMIFESRPNVTPESAALCLKSGNAVILRGGSEAFYSNQALVNLINQAAKEEQLPAGAIQLLNPSDRQSITILSRMNHFVDLIIARGSEEMIEEVSANATVPVLGHGKGVCHIYVDQSADIEKAVNITFNGKVQRPGVCNATESVLIHEHVLYDFLPRIAEKFLKAGVEMRGDDRVRGIFSGAREATEEDWGKEYHDKIISMKVVDSLGEAIDHINRYGSGHTDSIITEDEKASQQFQAQVDSSCVMANASTRLHDGGVFGFGSEIGISTNKLHARGTMGLRDLTSKKYLVFGTGQIRE